MESGKKLDLYQQPPNERSGMKSKAIVFYRSG